MTNERSLAAWGVDLAAEAEELETEWNASNAADGSVTTETA